MIRFHIVTSEDGVSCKNLEDPINAQTLTITKAKPIIKNGLFLLFYCHHEFFTPCK